jgi:hypothetical protein
MFSSDGNLGDERMPLDAVKSVGKVWEKCAKSVQIVGNRQPGRGVGGTRDRRSRDSGESGVGSRDSGTGLGGLGPTRIMNNKIINY